MGRTSDLGAGHDNSYKKNFFKCDMAAIINSQLKKDLELLIENQQWPAIKTFLITGTRSMN